MQSWTDQPDSKRRCALGSGAIRNEENVARLLHSGISEPRTKALRIDELFWNESRPISNECGISSGPSIDRCSSLTDEQLIARSEVIAGERRTGTGALIAQVGKLRAISHEPEHAQIVFIYDDPKVDNLEHGVLRGLNTLETAQKRYVRDEIIREFENQMITR